ncbi:uncharacterized protein CIMG_10964 [Coccidioides immitis RS]|uniref:Uncharacterized protein n=1 Tax=Coccidioides immitis (strain RS) TaxID=246410 RepID=A0A0D8JUP8_COCIM|nr:uncharacterized protein CIMG_10964 [Coccidioides immitis RS]KJF60003.1 hypothetical protein CIMG_10964 [Coccidioides immitis RS]
MSRLFSEQFKCKGKWRSCLPPDSYDRSETVIGNASGFWRGEIPSIPLVLFGAVVSPRENLKYSRR